MKTGVAFYWCPTCNNMGGPCCEGVYRTPGVTGPGSWSDWITAPWGTYRYATTTTSGPMPPPAPEPEAEAQINTGWICPACNRGLAPWVDRCNHKGAE